MRSTAFSRTSSAIVRERFAPKICLIDPSHLGPRSAWPSCFRRCRDLGFDYFLLTPIFYSGTGNDPLLAVDHERLNPRLDPHKATADFLQEFTGECREYDLEVLLDIVVGRLSLDARIFDDHPQWLRRPNNDRIDPRVPRRSGEARFRLDESTVAQEFVQWWGERLSLLSRAGLSGFRCLDIELVPAPVWQRIISAVAESYPASKFLAWTPGLDWASIAALTDAGFSGAFSSVAWWDGHAPWLAEEHQLLARIGAVIGAPEVPAGSVPKALIPGVDIHTQLRHLLRRAAATSDGIMLPLQIDSDGAVRIADPTNGDGPQGEHKSPADQSDLIRETNALVDEIAGCSVGPEMRVFPDSSQITTIIRVETSRAADNGSGAVALINSDLHQSAVPEILNGSLPFLAGSGLATDRVISADNACERELAPGEVRVIAVRQLPAVRLRRAENQASKLASQPRIVIDNITPSVKEGRFSAKRIAGEPVHVNADVFSDGHELLAVELLWRPCDEKSWRQQAMTPLGNDRWTTAILPDRIGRYEYTIAAWWDRYGSFCRDLKVKRDAKLDVGLELVEGQELLQLSLGRIEGDEREVIAAALSWLNDASADEKADILLAHDLQEVMYDAEEHQFFFRHSPPLTIEVESSKAIFAAWYELFPRSATDSVERHGTFDDVITRLPAIRDMGFDVLYMPPIHPIGTTNRKGKNNSLAVEPSDVGSPYAIGSAEGGHDAVHRSLGDITGFKRLRDAASALGMEIALDFAIQCSPDHPWLKEHPEWFRRRPDGSIRYAENPPKKYQDIVNVDFYAPEAFPSLWQALRDVVLYWRGEGVRLFRVDNPHTKPLPFWEWLIADVRGRYPDVVFLSEAFTRPKIMYRLAMAGFSQSYSYFTWRNTKQELTDYFTELTTTDVSDYFRPHLFVNTPDINPYFLQTSGRPGFLIRAALAATLSGLWGLYSGFELCESAALPGREEYLDSEKYQIRVRQLDAPGNIVDEITKLNRIRRNHSALQSHLGLNFYPAHHGQVLLYGKMPSSRSEMILIAVNLDPFHSHEATIEVPLWEWKLPDSASVEVKDLMRGDTFTWRGKLQRVRLDPAVLPFAIWQVKPGVDG